MSKTLVVRVVTLTVLLVAFAAIQVSAGGPVCPRPMCPQPMCAPPMCCPPPCPPPRCQENPLAMICKGAFQIVAGVVALPFRVVGCLAEGLSRPMRCGPPPMMAGCAPPMCPPPVCGPGYGMGPGRPVGFGGGAPRRFAPMAEKSKSLPLTLIAGPNDGVFGGYW